MIRWRFVEEIEEKGLCICVLLGFVGLCMYIYRNECINVKKLSFSFRVLRGIIFQLKIIFNYLLEINFTVVWIER